MFLPSGTRFELPTGFPPLGGERLRHVPLSIVSALIKQSLESVNGPGVTVIQGFQLTGETNGDGARICVPRFRQLGREQKRISVKSSGIDSQKPFHALDQIAVWSFDDQVEVVGHETKAVNLPGGFPAGLIQGRKE